MPQTDVCFFSDEGGESPIVEWLAQLRQSDQKAFAKCVARIGRLALLGHEIRRPEADYLRDGLHELRIRKGHVNYRLLYFFHGQNVAVLVHALTKEGAVPDTEIERALRRKKAFEVAPKLHTYREDSDG